MRPHYLTTAFHNGKWFTPWSLKSEYGRNHIVSVSNVFREIEKPEAVVTVEYPLLDSYNEGLISKESYHNYRFRGFNNDDMIELEVKKFRVHDLTTNISTVYENMNGKIVELSKPE